MDQRDTLTMEAAPPETARKRRVRLHVVGRPRLAWNGIKMERGRAYVEKLTLEDLEFAKKNPYLVVEEL